MPSNDDLLFADHAVRAGFLTREELDETLAVQARMEEMGVRDSLRNVLVNRGILREGDAAIVSRQAGLASGREPIPGYTLESRLGAGAMGSVYKAWQKGMRRYVAVKILRRDLTSDPRQVERLRREAELVGKLDHPYIVRGLDSGESEGLVWFAMEYVEGRTLRERIQREGRLPWADAVRTTRQIAEALVHAHSQGVVHRDIKPGNILLEADDTPRLTDYGLAKGQSDDALTQIDATLGTPQYVAPEQARNPRDVDIRSDVYSLGATLYVMLTGRPPFDGETLAQTLTKVLYERPRPVRELAPDVPAAAAYVVERMMAKDRAHRYAGPAELLVDLRKLEAGRLTAPQGFDGDIGTFVEKRKRRRTWLAGAAIVAAGAVVAFGVATLRRRSEHDRSNQSAERALEVARMSAGAPETWTGESVDQQIRSLEAIVRDHGDAPAAESAAAELADWRKRRQAILDVQSVVRRAQPEDGSEPAWAAIHGELTALCRRLGPAEPEGVARRIADSALSALEERRDRRARTEIERVAALPETSDPAASSLDRAGEAWRRASLDISSRYFGGGEAAPVREARERSEAFQSASRGLATAWEPFEALRLRDVVRPDTLPGAGARQGGASHRVLLDACAETAKRIDLASLPPSGRWVRAAEAAESKARASLDAWASSSWQVARGEAERLRGAKKFREALTLLDAFTESALPEQVEAIHTLRGSIAREATAAADIARDRTLDAAMRFLDAFGRHDEERARGILADLGRPDPLVGGTGADAAPTAFRSAADALLDATRAVLWDRLREKLPAYAAAGGEIRMDSGVRYGGISNLRVSGDSLAFTSSGGGASQEWTGSLRQIAIDDIFAIAAPSLDTPRDALVVAALRLAQYQIPKEPKKGVPVLAALGPLLDTARRFDPGAACVEQLARVRDAHVAATQREIDDAEATAERRHGEAAAALAQSRAADAADILSQLLDVPRLFRTEYVTRRRDEIRAQIQQASRMRAAAGFAGQYPGARWTDLADGQAELRWDFEDPACELPEGRAALGAASDRLRAVLRISPVYSRPAADAGSTGVPVSPGHVFEWREDTGRVAGSDAPLRVRCPFSSRKRIEVTFLVRAERPVFFGVNVLGAACGVLSAQESRFGGRGVKLWGAPDLAEADRAFDERYRRAWIESHPDAFRREEATRYARFEPGRVHRVRFVREERRASLWIDGRLRAEDDLAASGAPSSPYVQLLAWGQAEIDDLRIVGTPEAR